MEEQVHVPGSGKFGPVIEDREGCYSRSAPRRPYFWRPYRRILRNYWLLPFNGGLPRRRLVGWSGWHGSTIEVWNAARRGRKPIHSSQRRDWLGNAEILDERGMERCNIELQLNELRRRSRDLSNTENMHNARYPGEVSFADVWF